MPCLKTYTISEAASGESPLHDAAYASNVDKIFGTSGPYVIKFNATTGVREGMVRLSSPMYGDCRICYHAGTGMLFAAGHNEINNQGFGLPHPSRDVWKVNPTTLAVTPLNVGSWLTNFEFDVGNVFGPQWIKADGNYLYFQYESRNLGFYWARVNASNFADHNMGGINPVPPMNTEQFDVSNGFVYHIEPRFGDINKRTVAGAFDDSMNVYPYPITAIQKAFSGQFYMVCGTPDFLRIDSFGGGIYTVFQLTDIPGIPLSGINPVRLKAFGNRFYIPCMGANGVIVWDSSSDNPNDAVWKTGYENPVDIVQTPLKIWVVQNSPIGLKEIIPV